jgi:four helix bundle protein
MEKFRFLKWPVYKDSQKLFGLILKIYETFPNHIKYSIGQQLIRAAFSIILNIAEGSGRKTDKELKRYFDISLGSSYELLACADTLHDQKLITDESFEEIYSFIDKITNQLGGFKKSI